MTDLDLERETIRREGEEFEALLASAAWKSIRKYLAEECERSKGFAVTTVAGASVEFNRAVFIGWQQREQVAIGIDSFIEDRIEKYKGMLEEIADERISSSDRPDRSGW